MTSIQSSLSLSRSESHSGSGSSVHSFANTITSTAPLTAAYRPPPKDFAAAFANLQAQYGMSGDFPGRVVQSQGAPKKKKQRKSPPSRATTPHGPGQPSSSSSQLTSSSPTAVATAPLHRARTHPMPNPRLSSSSDRVDAARDASNADAATDDKSAVEVDLEGQPRGDKDKGKSKASGVSKLRRIFGLRHKRNK
ncbi:hypothetical protein MVEN_00438600 [Mycena venus]|uniref:Uncharacterized protein n=1 Tax=Mycena venus TaxID=2733690 RepID=A0A8H7D8V6_9AGAR|nr:hypothetical protein MVEN_00438600 [Mycena venus]